MPGYVFFGNMEEGRGLQHNCSLITSLLFHVAAVDSVEEFSEFVCIFFFDSLIKHSFCVLDIGWLTYVSKQMRKMFQRQL